MLVLGFIVQQLGGFFSQRQLIMNYLVFINRFGLFFYFQQFFVGYFLYLRFVFILGGMVIMQNQFFFRILFLVFVLGQYGLLNGVLDYLLYDFYFILILDFYGDFRLYYFYFFYFEYRVILIRLEVFVVLMFVYDNMLFFIVLSEVLFMNQLNIILLVFQLE